MSARRVFAGVAAALLAGCGVPTSGAPETIPASEVPYGLASPTPTDPTPGPTETMMAATAIYLVTPEDVLVATGRETPTGSTEEQLDALLDELASGPTKQERADELSTALPPEVELDVVDVSGATVTIDISGPVEAPSGSESRRAVGQIVLTATSLPGVRAVLLTRQGERVDAPLPDGQLTSAPLTATDYEVLLTAPAPTATPAAPPPEATPAVPSVAPPT
jgi:spore germination protein GerM